ncbi:MAG: sugar phosphate isomerase/epimerase [Myxococcales bacterium]|nr:sugar phosphate isomerase/epimerase [Myxococcales bacterium]
MRLAYSTNGYTRTHLADAIRRIGAVGYQGVELLADDPHWTPGQSGALVRAVRAALADAGVAVSNVNANTAMGLWPSPMPETVFEPSLSHHDPAVRGRRLAYTRAALDFAAEVGAPALSVTSGRTEAEYSPQEGMRWFADSLAKVCEWGQARGVRIGIEYEPGLLVETSTEVAQILATVGHSMLGANLDLGHAICAGEDPLVAIERLADRIWNVHMEDIRGQKHYHLVPGEGDVDFAALVDGLAAAGYDRWITVELYTCSARADAAASSAHRVLAPLVQGAQRP